MEHPDHLVAQTTLDFIETQRGQLLLHAGGVCTADGRAIVAHGQSGSGKTTLTAALVHRGLAYLTDETVCLDPHSLQILPFPKPLTVKPGSQKVLSRLRPPAEETSPDSGFWQLQPERLGGPAVPVGPIRPALIVFPTYDSTAGGVEVAPVSKARAAFVLGEQSSALWAIEPRPLAALARLVSVAPAYQVSYSDAFEAAEAIAGDLFSSALASTPGDLEVSDRHAGVARPQPQDHKQPGGQDRNPLRPRRALTVDWLVLDGEAVLFDGEQLHHLDVPGTATWQTLDGELAVPEVALALAEAFNADPDRVLVDVEDLVRVFNHNGLLG